MTVVIDGTGTSTFPTVDGVTMLEGSTAMPRMVQATSQASTSGTAISFTGIPSWVKRVTMMLNNVSTSSAASNVVVRIGSGSYDTSGYQAICGINSTTGANVTTLASGFSINANASLVAASYTLDGAVTLSLIGSNIWVISGVIGNYAETRSYYPSGSKALSGALDRIQLTTVGGTDTFDLGNINIIYEG